MHSFTNINICTFFRNGKNVSYQSLFFVYFLLHKVAHTIES